MARSASACRRLCQPLVALALAHGAARAQPVEAAPPSPLPEEAPAPAEPPDPDDDDERDRTLGWQGSYWGLEAHGGTFVRLERGSSDSPGPLFGASARISSIMMIADIRATTLVGTYDTRLSDGRTVDITRASFGIEGHGHPFFITILKGGVLYQLLSGLYGAIGADIEVVSASTTGYDETVAGISWHVGGGGDLPLTSPHAPWSLWLGLAYRMKFLDARTDLPGLRDFDEHLLLLTLGLRHLDIPIRLPRPDEFDRP